MEEQRRPDEIPEPLDVRPGSVHMIRTEDEGDYSRFVLLHDDGHEGHGDQPGDSMGVALMRRTGETHRGRLIYRAVNEASVPQEIEVDMDPMAEDEPPEYLSIEMWTRPQS